MRKSYKISLIWILSHAGSYRDQRYRRLAPYCWVTTRRINGLTT